MPNANLIQLLAQAVTDEQDRFRSRITEIIEGALGLSESEVVASISQILGINDEARRHVGDLRSLVDRTGSEREITAEVIEQQSRYCREAVVLLRKQSDVAERSQKLSQDISVLVETIGRISNAARILTVNGQIESVRMGSQGAAFAVIANQMRELSKDVSHANQAIAELAGRLNEFMPIISQTAQSLLGMTEAFSAEQVQQVSRFQAAADSAKQQMNSALGESQERAERLIAKSDEMLTHLQFQDRVAQDLRGVVDLAGHHGSILTALLELLAQRGEEVGDVASAVQQALREARKSAEPASRRLSSQKEGPDANLASGDTVLF